METLSRRLRDPSANQIPDEFVALWSEAVKTNSKAFQLFEGLAFALATG